MGLSLGIGLGISGNNSGSAASRLLNGAQGLAIDFAAQSLAVIDSATPANNYNGVPSGKLTYTAPSAKWTLRANGVYAATDGAGELPYEWDASGNALGIRVEPAATNLYTYSRDIENQWTLARVVPTNNSGPTLWSGSPGGVGNAMCHVRVDDTAAATHAILKSATVGLGDRVLAWWFVKAKEYDKLRVSFASARFGATVVYNFDLTAVTATLVTPGTNDGAGIFEVYDGIYCIYQYAECTSAGAGNITLFLLNEAGLTTYDGDATSGVYVDQGQCEVGTYPSSPIITTTATATRAYDNLTMASSGVPFDNTKGTLFVRASTFDLVGGAARGMFHFNDGSENNRIQLYQPSTGSQPFRFLVTAATATQCNILPAGTLDINEHYTSGYYAVDDTGQAYDGVLATPDTTAPTSPTGITTIRIGSTTSGSVQTFIGHIKQVAYKPIRASDATVILTPDKWVSI